MQDIVLLLSAAAIGFSHSFEADHLVAVSSIVTRRDSTISAIKDGVFWGLGHTSTILLVAIIYILSKFALNEDDFRYFEAGVGIMLIILGFVRFYRVFQERSHGHLHIDEPSFGLAYGVGLVHGLAGSGSLLISILTQIRDNFMAITYILIFGLGSIIGMMLAAGIFSLPFSAKFINNRWFSMSLSIISAVLCIGLGVVVFYRNIHQ
ncbi:hydantoin utilization protein A [Emticicia aquatilis]|uniref:Hydantoin utilization protein A n=1 Tax=Emticicia aquatilis TaxID=1537369 RepID=A0A916Z136_9BACT|nr:urease accessory protein [Emticicia aquatilis]GGD70626.1 hydantoin utilization protein A [Emticicia aquatilis]